MIENSMVINDGQPEYCVERAMHILNRYQKAMNGARILVLGVAYKQDIDDYRESPAIRVIEELKKVGAVVEFYDPWVAEYREKGEIYPGIKELSPQVVEGYDLVMFTTAHSNVDYDMVVNHAQAVFDTKYVTKGMGNRENVEVL